MGSAWTCICSGSVCVFFGGVGGLCLVNCLGFWDRSGMAGVFLEGSVAARPNYRNGFCWLWGCTGCWNSFWLVDIWFCAGFWGWSD